MSTSKKEEEQFWEELGKEVEKYKDILFEINKALRQELRHIGVRKNIVPSKYILPKAYITRLLEIPQFRRAWQGKKFWVYQLTDLNTKGDEEKRKWVQVQSFPNIGGVPVEEGLELKVIIERVPRRKRLKK